VADDAETEQIRLVEADLNQANELIKGVTTIGAGVRTAAITTWLGLLGFGFQQKLAPLAFLAALVALLFFVADAYHGWVYAQALSHASHSERVLGDYYSSLSRRSDDPSVHIELTGLLRSYRFGCYRSITRRFRPWHLFYARPQVIYRGLYPVLFVVALAVGLSLSDVSTSVPAS